MIGIKLYKSTHCIQCTLFTVCKFSVHLFSLYPVSSSTCVHCIQVRCMPVLSVCSFIIHLHIHYSEVLKFIKEAPSKTCSLDPCPTHIVKQCIDILLPSLTKLVNLSLKNGIFPNPFKQAIVTPLLKKSTLSKEDLKSYRLMSGLASCQNWLSE